MAIANLDFANVQSTHRQDMTTNKNLSTRHVRQSIKSSKLAEFDPQILQQGIDQFTIDYDQDLASLWLFYNHPKRPCYTSEVLDEILNLQLRLRDGLSVTSDRLSAPRFLIWGSKMDGVFNLGGDLELFVTFIRNQDEEGLRRYAYRCVDTVFNNLTNLGLPLVNISLVQGDALGGGFEAVLSSDVVIAEKQSKFGLPEVLFNLFPGMGAYSLLCRRLDGARAMQMIMSGRLYSAEELYELGLVDVLAEQGEGVAAVRRYIEQSKRRHPMLLAMNEVRQRCQPVTYDELIDVTDIWVDTTLRLTKADLRRMERLVKAQKRRSAGGCSLKER